MSWILQIWHSYYGKFSLILCEMFSPFIWFLCWEKLFEFYFFNSFHNMKQNAKKLLDNLSKNEILKRNIAKQ